MAYSKRKVNGILSSDANHQPHPNTWSILSILQVTKSGLSWIFLLTNPWWFHDFYLHLLLLWLEDCFLVWRGLCGFTAEESSGVYSQMSPFVTEFKNILATSCSRSSSAKLQNFATWVPLEKHIFSLMFLFITFQMGWDGIPDEI